VILPVEACMDLRRYPSRAAGATWREIADEVGVDWRTVKKYLSTDAAGGPPAAPSRRGYVTHILVRSYRCSSRLPRQRSYSQFSRN
jgi:hypothetical protein